MHDNHFLILVIAASILLLIFGCCIIFMFAYMKKRNNVHFFDKLDMERKIQVSKVEEGERMINQIARDIHDNLGQSANALKMNLMVVRKLATDEKQIRTIDKTFELADQIIKDTTNIGHSLNSDFIKTTCLPTLLNSELDRLCTPQNIAHNLLLSGNLNTIDSDKKLLIYRIAQDAIHNVVQHANASLITITLTQMNDSFSMLIADNGTGIAQDRLHAKYGVGINNMKQRANYLNGQLSINSEPGVGCTVTLLADRINFGNN